MEAPKSPTHTFSVAYGSSSVNEVDSPENLRRRWEKVRHQKRRYRIARHYHLAYQNWQNARTIIDRLTRQRQFEAVLREWMQETQH